jgi:hypothetical protein
MDPAVFVDNRSRNVHHSIVEFGGQWYLFYHVQDPSWFERRVAAEYLEYGLDGSIQPVAMTKEGVRATRALEAVDRLALPAPAPSH